MPNQKNQNGAPFRVRDCALVVLATGMKAQNLGELRQGIRSVEAASLYHHFWGRLLQPRFDEPEYNNDFASWTYRALGDKTLAERLSVIDPTDYATLEDLREELSELVEMREEEPEAPAFAGAMDQFQFLKSQVVVFDTGKTIEKPDELAHAIDGFSPGAVYYHFIDARRRTSRKQDDFSVWLSGLGKTYRPLVARLGAVDPYFSSLSRLREQLSGLFKEVF